MWGVIISLVGVERESIHRGCLRWRVVPLTFAFE